MQLKPRFMVHLKILGAVYRYLYKYAPTVAIERGNLSSRRESLVEARSFLF